MTSETKKFVFQHGPDSAMTRLDEDGKLWVTLEEFPNYEIASPKELRVKSTKRSMIIGCKGRVKGRVMFNRVGRSAELLFRKSFRVFNTGDGKSLPGEEWRRPPVVMILLYSFLRLDEL